MPGLRRRAGSGELQDRIFAARSGIIEATQTAGSDDLTQGPGNSLMLAGAERMTMMR